MSALANRKLTLAYERLERGDVAGARALCEQILARAPRNPDALCLYGQVQIASERPAEAIPAFEKALAGAPQNGPVLENLGLAHMMLGQFAKAESWLTRAAGIHGAPPSVGMRLGIALLYQGKLPEAIEALRQAIARDPDNIDCHLALGQAYGRAGDAPSARAHFEAMLRLEPRHADALYNLGVLSLQQAPEAARRWFEKTLQTAPDHVEAMVNLGVLLQLEGKLDEAAACFRRTLAVNSRFVSARNNLARTLALQGRLAEARDEYRRTLEFDPGMMEAREGLASVCVALGRLKEGIAALREILQRNPGHESAHAALAEALFQNGDLEEAEATAAQASRLNSALTGPYSTRALVHIVRGETERAIDVLEAGFRQTDGSGLLGMLAHQLRRACDWKKWQAAWDEIVRRLDHASELGSPFWLLSQPATAEQQRAYAERWAKARFGTPTTPARRTDEQRGQRRLRVGYLSSDFYDHAAAYLLAGVLERHDRERFEIFAYSYGPEDQGGLRKRISAACEHFTDIAWEPQDVAVRRIEADRLDVLVDLKGYTLGARTAILAQRPCPIQVNWLGYPGTMGARFIDYLIADDFIVPKGSEAAYTEQVVRLTPCWQCNDESRPVIEPLTRRAYGLPDEGFVFCCFNQAIKISPETFDCWMRLLARVPGSVLWLADDSPPVVRNLTEAAQGRGIGPERVVFSPRLPYAQHLARYRVADLALDTFPYTSHSTASDALWLGCPLVALCGDTFAARVSGSILTAAGLVDLVTYSLADYEDLAFRIATDADRAKAIRFRVESAKHSPLFDAAGYARGLETIYTDLVAAGRR